MSRTQAATPRMIPWLLSVGRAYWTRLAALFGLSLLATPLALMAPVPLMLVVDSVLGDKPLPGVVRGLVPEAIAASKPSLLVLLAATVVLIAVASLAQNAASTLLDTLVGRRLLLDLRAMLFGHAQRLSARHHDAKGTADALYRIQSDAPALQSLIVNGLTPFFTASLTLAGMLFVMARLDAAIMLLALTIAPVIYFLTGYFRDRLRHEWRNVKESESNAQAVVHEVLGALRVVQAFGREDAENARFAELSTRSLKQNVKVVFLDSAFGMLVGVTMAVGTALVLYLGATRVQQGSLTVGGLLLVMSYLGQLYAPMTQIGKQITKIQGWLASAERVQRFLAETPDVQEKPDALPIRRAKGAIRFSHVSFAYEGEHLVLDDIDFEVPAGAKVGIAGQTGAGKSTLTNLLMRFYDPTRGQIFLDGVDLRDFQLRQLRDQFALVLQDSILFSASVAENIAYGKPGATDAEIVRAATAANADGFINALPDGYLTAVGERGMRLSGGQRQRIALARAFLRDAPVLILDEPTSAVDLATETLIMDALQELMRGRTTFMIAHRLSTLESCDLILRIDPGGRLKRVDDRRAIARAG